MLVSSYSCCSVYNETDFEGDHIWTASAATSIIIIFSRVSVSEASFLSFCD